MYLQNGDLQPVCLFSVFVYLFLSCYLLMLSDEAAAQAGLGTTPNQQPKPFPPKVTANILFSLPRKLIFFHLLLPTDTPSLQKEVDHLIPLINVLTVSCR